MMKRRTLLLTLLAGLALLLAACGAENGAEPAPAGSPAGQQEVLPDDIGVGTPGQIRLVEFYADW